MHPVTARLQPSAAGLVRDLEGEVTKTITDNDISFHALRAYEPGDPLRNVHWRTSARTGQLMVRQYEETRRSQLVLLQSTERSHYASDDEFELGVSVLASLSVQVIRDGTRLDVVTEGRKLRTATPTALLDDTSRIETVEGAFDSLREFVRDGTKRLAAASVAIVVGGSVVPLADFRSVETVFGPDTQMLAFRVELGAASRIASIAGTTVVTVGVALRPAATRAEGAPVNRLPRTVVTDLIVLSVLSLLGIAGYETSFGDLNFLVAAVAGIAIGTVAAVVGSLLRLGVLTTVLLGLAAYFVLGTPFTMPGLALFAVLPSLPSLTGLAVGAVYGWADIVTIGTPVEAPYYIAAVPYFAAWLVSLVGAMLVIRWLPKRRTVLRSSLLLIGPVLLYLSGILLGTDEAYLAGVRGVAFATIALVWIAWRRGADVEASGDGAKRLRAQKLRGSAVVVAGAVAIGAVAGLAIAPVAPDRFVLRDEIVPPFDPLEFPSPLAGFRNYTKDLAEQALFTATGLEPGDTIRLATMDSYTGRLWNVAGPERSRRRRRLRDRRRDAARTRARDTRQLARCRDLGRGVRRRLAAHRRATGPRCSSSTTPAPHAGETCATTRRPALPCSRAASTRAPRYRLEAQIQQEPDDRAAHRHPGSVARAHARREPARRRRGEGRGVRRRGDQPHRAAAQHRACAEDQWVPQSRTRLRLGRLARRAWCRPPHRAVHAHPDGRRRRAVRRRDGAHGPAPRLPVARRHGLRARDRRGR